MIPATIHIVENKKYRWINVVHPGEEELQYLEKTYSFHPLDLKDCLPPLQRPKVVPRQNYLFAIFIFPLFNPHSGEIEQREVDFFIMKDRIITVHDNAFIDLKNFFQLLELKPDYRHEIMSSSAHFVSQILDELFDACFPMLFHVSSDIDSLRTQVLHGYSRKTVHEILRLKNNIAAFRKTMQPHRDLLRRIINLLPKYIKMSLFDQHFFDRLVDHTKEIWDHLETYFNAIDAVQDTHTTLIQFRLNEIMKTLTVFSIIIMSLTFISNLFIIDGVSTPIIGNYFDWWAIVGTMTIGVIAAIGIFKKKKWL